MDFISVTCYDYQFPHESNVNHPAPLSSLEQDTGYDADINIVSKIHPFKINLLYLVSIYISCSKVTTLHILQYQLLSMFGRIIIGRDIQLYLSPNVVCLNVILNNPLFQIQLFQACDDFHLWFYHSTYILIGCQIIFE